MLSCQTVQISLMNSTDLAKLTDNGKTGVAFTNNVTCNIVENRSIGNDLPVILHIENITVNKVESKNINFGN